MLKLYLISYYHHDDIITTLKTYVLGYNQCHAVNLFYRELDSHGDLNNYSHCGCEEISCIHPSQFKR